MEELGASKLTKLSALSKSSEQLDQLWRNSADAGGPDREKRSVSYFDEAREARGKERAKKKQHASEQVEKEAEVVVQKTTQGQTQNQTQKKQQLNSEPSGDATTVMRSRSTSPTSRSSSRARIHSSPAHHGPVTQESRSSIPPSETSSTPPSPRGLEISERELKSASSSPIQTKLPCEIRPSSR